MPQYPLLTGDVVEIRLCAEIAEQRTINVFHYKIGGGTPQSNDTQALMTAFNAAWWNGALADLLSEDVYNVFLQLQTIAPVRKVVDDQLCSPTEGQVAARGCPPTTAVVLAKRTPLAGAANRGRVFVPGIPFDDILDGRVAVAKQAEWNAQADLLAQVLTFNSKTATPVLYSTASSVERGTITDGTFDAVLRVQRRREVGRGI